MLDTEVTIEGDEDAAVETLVNLEDAFAASDSGQLVVRVAATRTFEPDTEDFYLNCPAVAWIQRTTLGVNAILVADLDH